jgi:DNA-binding NtrC family response regulator
MATAPYSNERSNTILVVEDEVMIRSIVRIVLERMGHIVLEAVDGADGLTISRNYSGPIDLVISDVRMPRMDGPEMVSHLQTERPGIKVLLISAYSTQSLLSDLTVEFLAKPFLPATIANKVQEILSRGPGSLIRRDWPQQEDRLPEAAKISAPLSRRG